MQGIVMEKLLSLIGLIPMPPTEDRWKPAWYSQVKILLET
jgi:hypothetical protein